METTKQLALVNGQHVQVLTHEDEVYVPIRPICDILGINYSSQFEKIKSDPLKSKGFVLLSGTKGSDGRLCTMGVLKFKYVLTWMLSINANNVKEEIREHLMEYQDQCSDILCDYFLKEGRAIKIFNAKEANLYNEIKMNKDNIATAKKNIKRISNELALMTEERHSGRYTEATLFEENTIGQP